MYLGLCPKHPLFTRSRRIKMILTPIKATHKNYETAVVQLKHMFRAGLEISGMSSISTIKTKFVDHWCPALKRTFKQGLAVEVDMYLMAEDGLLTLMVKTSDHVLKFEYSKDLIDAYSEVSKHNTLVRKNKIEGPKKELSEPCFATHSTTTADTVEVSPSTTIWDVLLEEHTAQSEARTF